MAEKVYYSHFNFQPTLVNKPFTATFGGSGHVIKWNLADDAGRSPLYTRVGFADKEGEKWNVYRDDGRVLFEHDGWQFRAMFWAF